MYRKQTRIPTLFALLIIFTGIGTALFLDQNTQSLNSFASTPSIPKEIRISNVTGDSFTVSYLTEKETLGNIRITANNNQKLLFLDDLDSDNVPRPRKTHMATAKNLIDQTSYSIQIRTGDGTCKEEQFCPTLTQVTAPKLSTPLNIPPMHGSILKDANGIPAVGALIYAQVGKNSLLSSRVDSSGLWVIPLTNLHSNDLSSHAQVNDDDLVQLTIQLSPNETASAVVDIKSIKQNFPVPAITIGNSYNFVNLSSKKDLFAQNINQGILGVSNALATPSPVLGPTGAVTGGIVISFPKQDFDTTPDSRPRIRGTGKPGMQLLITVNSTPQTGKVTVGKDGSWAFRPQKELSAGTHQLSISVTDEKGNLITLNRSFVVLKSGEQVLGDSTPSASLTPTLTPTTTATPLPTPANTLTPVLPTHTPSPTLIPSPTTLPPATSAPQPQPRSGSIKPVLFLLGGGGSLLLIGTALLLL